MKRFFVLPLLAAGYFLNAQTIGNSPYAAFGIGDIKYDNTADVNAMGGISTAYIWDFNNNFNFSNPAANKNLELATLKVEGTNENNFYKSNFDNMSVTKHSSYLSNISIAFPLSPKVKFGLGYQPYSSKNYLVLTNETLSDGTTIKGNLYSGKGTISTVQAAVSYQITPEFALGLRTNFYFGNLYDISEISYNTAELINGYETKNKTKSFNFTLGTAYQKKLEQSRKLTLGATVTLGNTGTLETQYINSTYFYTPGQVKNNVSVIDSKYTQNTDLIPLGFSVGAGYGKDAKWFLGTQVDYSKQKIDFLTQPFTNQNSYKISAGGWYLPNYNNFRNYFSRVTYRYGAYYQKGNLSYNGTSVNEFALTGGLSFPFENKSASRMSGIDLGIELGKRGTLDNNLIRQNFVNLKIGLNFAQKWFEKRLYD
jgi:hypothetical protein